MIKSASKRFMGLVARFNGVTERRNILIISRINDYFGRYIIKN